MRQLNRLFRGKKFIQDYFPFHRLPSSTVSSSSSKNSCRSASSLPPIPDRRASRQPRERPYITQTKMPSERTDSDGIFCGDSSVSYRATTTNPPSGHHSGRGLSVCHVKHSFGIFSIRHSVRGGKRKTSSASQARQLLQRSRLKGRRRSRSGPWSRGCGRC